MTTEVELALGTVQFGLPYGVAGRGEVVPPSEVREILHCAADFGIRMLDTAAAYGDIEARLIDLAGDNEFSITTKLPSLPHGLRPGDVETWVREALQRSHDRLGKRLKAVLFHRAEDVLSPSGPDAWAACAAFASERDFKVGVSCYDPETLDLVRGRVPVAVAQLPGNALDQRIRLHSVSRDVDVEIHLRSIFLQGLLLMPEAEAIRRLPAASVSLTRWTKWCREREMTPLEGAIAIAKGLPGVRYCVVGVDRVSQLEEIHAAWDRVAIHDVAGLACANADVIDPRRWNAS